MNTEIVEIFKENGGYLTRKELQNGKQRYQLRRMAEEKIVKRVKPGVYLLKELASTKTMIDVERVIPKAFCVIIQRGFITVDHAGTTILPHCHREKQTCYLA